MSKKLLITTNKYRISTEAKNSKGLRIRTKGINLGEFENNPLLLWMHQRPEGKKDDVLPLGNIVEPEFVNNELWARLGFDPEDDFAVSIYNKYENGTLRMVSAGLIPLKLAKHAGEVWVDFSKLKEVSCVDIGSNPESYEVKLYEDTEELIQLSFDSLKEQNENLFKNGDMKLIQLQAGQLLPLLKLSEGSEPEKVFETIQGLITLSESQATAIQAKEQELLTLNASYTTLKTTHESMVKLANEEKIILLVDGAVDARKFTADQKDKWVKLAEGNFEGVKELIDGMPAHKTIEEQLNLNEGGDADELKELVKLSYDDLDKSGQLQELKDKAPLEFQKKYKGKYGVEYQG